MAILKRLFTAQAGRRRRHRRRGGKEVRRPERSSPPAPVKPPPSDGERLAGLDRAFADHVEALRAMVRTGGTPEVRQAAFDRLVACNGCPDALIGRRGMSARAAASFRRAMITWTAKAQIAPAAVGGRLAIEWMVKHKLHGHRLAGMLGATLPGRAGPMSAGEAVETVSKGPLPVLIKPIGAAGSHGVFVVHAADKVIDLRLTEWIGGLEALAGRMAAIGRAEWLVEEYIAKPGDTFCPAPDLKFFAFYGRIGLVLEVERFPARRYAWWTPEGERSPVKMYEGDFFAGGGFTRDQATQAAAISAKLPLPFVRIDFLRAGALLYFGEFTPRPGDFEQYDEDTDGMMGRLYLDAELRLHRDLLAGKTFPEFAAWAAPFMDLRIG